MAYRMLDMTAYARLDEYNYFRALAYPYVGVTVQVDITPLRARVRAEGLPFFLSLLYVTSRAANSIPEMRQRLHGDGIAEYDLCPTSHTVSLGGGRYCYCMLRADRPFEVFLPADAGGRQARGIHDGICRRCREPVFRLDHAGHRLYLLRTADALPRRQQSALHVRQIRGGRRSGAVAVLRAGQPCVGRRTTADGIFRGA